MKRDLIDKRNKLNQYSQRLRTLKFDTSAFNPKLNKEKITELIKEQDKIYKQFIFYKEYLKELIKERKIKMYYYLYYCDMYLEEIDFIDNKINSIKFSNKDQEVRAALHDFETAAEIRKIVFIELGIELKIDKFKVFGKEDRE